MEPRPPWTARAPPLGCGVGVGAAAGAPCACAEAGRGGVTERGRGGAPLGKGRRNGLGEVVGCGMKSRESKSIGGHECRSKVQDSQRAEGRRVSKGRGTGGRGLAARKGPNEAQPWRGLQHSRSPIRAGAWVSPESTGALIH